MPNFRANGSAVAEKNADRHDARVKMQCDEIVINNAVQSWRVKLEMTLLI